MPRRLGGAADPHAWQSLVLAQRYVENARAGLVQAGPALSSSFNERAADYQKRIALHVATRARLSGIPAAERRVITSHDAFGYFGAAYRVELRAAQGWSTASEASAADVARIIRQLRTERVRALFVENINDPRMLERIAREAGARIGGTLYSDALSPPGTPGDSYLRMFEHNVTTLLAALLEGYPLTGRHGLFNCYDGRQASGAAMANDGSSRPAPHRRHRHLGLGQQRRRRGPPTR